MVLAIGAISRLELLLQYSNLICCHDLISLDSSEGERSSVPSKRRPLRDKLRKYDETLFHHIGVSSAISPNL